MTTDRDSRSPWSDVRDGVFFRIVQAAFPPAFLAAATALLASYDDSSAAGAPDEAAPDASAPVARHHLSAPRSPSLSTR